MENFTLHAIIQELVDLLTGHRVGKIYQLGTTDLALDFRLRDGRWLLISTDPNRMAMYLTARSLKQFAHEARSDTPFVALGKKHLSGARLIEVEKTGYDRVVRFSFLVEDESGTESKRDLVVQLTGRSANVFLLEQEQIIVSLRERQSDENSYHELLPPADKLDPFELSPEKLTALIEASEGDLVAAARVNLIGFGRQYAEEFAARAQPQAPEKALAEMLTEIFSAMPKPVVYSSAPLEELKRQIGATEFSLAFAPIEFEHLKTLHHTSFATVNEAADGYFTFLDERRNFLAERQKIEANISARLKKLNALRKNLERELTTFSKGETHQRYGELLLSNLHQAQKNEAAFIVTDFYDPEQSVIEIPAANKPTAKEAAEHYFKLARKARHGLAVINTRLPEAQTEIAILESQLANLRSLTQRAELKDFNQPTGISPQKTTQKSPAAKKEKEKAISGVRRYLSSDGFEILVGRTSRDNDNLTQRIAKSLDLWFHAADYPGSHVILRNPKRSEIPSRALIEAAQLAAKFSHAKNVSGAKVAVNYCEKKFVSKPKGFAPGQVRLSAFKTILVEPFEAGKREF